MVFAQAAKWVGGVAGGVVVGVVVVGVVTGTELVAPDLKLQLIDQMPT